MPQITVAMAVARALAVSGNYRVVRIQFAHIHNLPLDRWPQCQWCNQPAQCCQCHRCRCLPTVGVRKFYLKNYHFQNASTHRKIATETKKKKRPKNNQNKTTNCYILCYTVSRWGPRTSCPIHSPFRGRVPNGSVCSGHQVKMSINYCCWKFIYIVVPMRCAHRQLHAHMASRTRK